MSKTFTAQDAALFSLRRRHRQPVHLFVIQSGEIEVTDENGAFSCLCLGVRNSIGERALLRGANRPSARQLPKPSTARGLIILLPSATCSST